MTPVKKKTKSPNDYPLLGYRVLPKIRQSLIEELEDVLVLTNTNLSEEEKPKRKNDIFISALLIGLKSLREKEEAKGDR